MRANSFVASAALLLASGCMPCPTGDRFESELPGCEESQCAEPTVEVGTSSTGFEILGEDQEVPVVFGPQGGYHVDASVRMQHLCPIVRIKVILEVEDESGDRVELSSEEHRVQAVRETSFGTEQDYWGLTAVVPCNWWPEGPHLALAGSFECEVESEESGHIDDAVTWLRIEAEDDNGRRGDDERRIRPQCCQE